MIDFPEQTPAPQSESTRLREPDASKEFDAMISLLVMQGMFDAFQRALT